MGRRRGQSGVPFLLFSKPLSTEAVFLAFLAGGRKTDCRVMSRYTNAEWAAIIAQTERDLVVSHRPHACPEISSPAFCKTIDHTLLKLEARDVQFDELCAEARTDRFAVC